MTKRTVDKYLKIAKQILDIWDGAFVARNFTLNYSSLGKGFESGATKMVYIGEHCDYVLKIPYEGSRNNYPFKGATLKTNHPLECNLDNDYCQREVNIYTLAQEAGLQCFFLRTIYIGSVYGKRIYLQKKIKNIGLDLEDIKGPIGLKAFSLQLNDVLYPIPLELSLHLAKTFDSEIIKNLVSFNQIYQIGDLHYYNIGIRNGFPIILDYANYLG